MTTMVTIHHVDGDKEFRKDLILGDVALSKVLFKFNPTDDPRTTALKAICASAIQMMLDHQASLGTAEPDANIRAARGRCAAVAITQVEGAQMALVKSLFALA